MVRARLTAINGVPADQVRLPSEEAREWLEREANLTWTRTLRDDNRLIAGEWWRDGDGGGPRVSVEREFAESLGLKIGDRLSYDAAGEPIASLLSGALAVAVGGTVHEATRKRLIGEAWRCEVPGVGLQAVALLSRNAAVSPELGALRRLATTVPRDRWQRGW